MSSKFNQIWRTDFLAVSLLLLITLARTLPHIFYGTLFFDSDQAVMGLMADDLAHLVRLPWTLYGQKYILAVEAWMAAPLFALWGPSIAALKFPMLILNLTTILLLYGILRRDSRLTIWQATCTTLFFAMVPLVPGAHMMAAEGGSFEPFLYLIILWLFRRKDITLGILLGSFYMHREFVILALPAFVITDIFIDQWKWQFSLKMRGKSLVIAAFTYFTLFGMGRWMPYFYGAHRPHSHLQPLRKISANLSYLVHENLAVNFGTATFPLQANGLLSNLDVAHFPKVALAAIGLLFIASILCVGRFPLRHFEKKQAHFPFYLTLCGIGNLCLYLLFIKDNIPPFVRYTLLSLFIPVGLAALIFNLNQRWASLMASFAAFIWLGVHGMQTWSLIDEQRQGRAPINPRQEAARRLLEDGWQWGKAPYWDAYYLTFLTGQTLKIASSEQNRIPWLEEGFQSATRKFLLSSEPLCPEAKALDHLWLCPN